MSEEYQESVYIGYIHLPNSHCRVRFVPMDGEPGEDERKAKRDVPTWAFSLLLVIIAVMIGLGGSFLLIPYGGLCR